MGALALAMFVVPGMSFAQSVPVPAAPSTASLQAEIVALMAQLQTLEAQLAAQGGSLPTSTPIRVCPAWGCNGPEPIIGPISITTTTPSITLVYPQGGETLDNGGKTNIATIQWSTQNFGNLNVSIYLKDANNNIIRQIAIDTSNAGSYAWAADPTLASGSYKLDVEAETIEPPANEVAVSGMFTVTTDVAPTPLITIVQPIAGDGYTANQPLPVYWNQNYVSKGMMISLFDATTGGGAAVFNSPYLAGVAAGNAYTIPANAVSSVGQYQITICDRSNSAAGKPLCAVSAPFNVAASTVAAPVLSAIDPASSTIGAQVTLTGSGFAATGNMVLFNGLVAASNLSSTNGAITFTVPRSLAPNCSKGKPCPMFIMGITGGTYNVSVVSNGVASNQLPLTVAGATIGPVSVTPTLSVAEDAISPAAGTIAMGSTGNALAVYDLGNTSKTEAINVTGLTVTDVSRVKGGTSLPTFTNLQLWNGSTLVGTAGSVAGISGSYTGTYTYAFHFAAPLVIPQGNTQIVTLKGDALPYSSGGATDGSVHAFSIATPSAVVALGATSNAVATVTGSASGNPMTVLRSTMAVSASPSSFVQNVKQAFQQIGSITLTANSAGLVAVKNLNLTFSGNISQIALSPFLQTVVLRGPNGMDVAVANYLGATENIGSNNISWTFASPTANNFSPFIISPGSSMTLQLWGTTSVIPDTPGVAQSLSATIQNASDIQYYDGTDAAAVATGGISLPSSMVPLTVTSLSWPVGITGSTFSITPSSLSFSIPAGGAAVDKQLTLINYPGGETIARTYSGTLPYGADWLSFSKPVSNSGSNSGAMTVEANTTNLTPGTYQGAVSFSSSPAGASITAQAVAVTLTVTPTTTPVAALPDIEITSITPTTAVQGQITNFTATIENDGAVNIATPFAVNLGGTATTISSLTAGQTTTVNASFGLTILGGNRVCAVADIWGTVAESNESNNTFCQTVTVTAPTTPVATPQVQVLTPTVSGTSVGISWSALSAKGVWGYNVFRSTTSGFVPNATNNGIASVVDGTSYTDKGLAPGTYYYVVAAMDGNGNIIDAPSVQVTASVAKTIVACPMVVPYCPYGGHSVAESNGCSETICNSAPTVPVPTVTISANPTTITAGQSSTLTWSSTNATQCSSGGVSSQTVNGVGTAWMGPTGTSQTVTVQPSATMVYTVTCTGSGGTSAPASVTVNVKSPVPVACPMVVPYCPYGGHSVTEANGCSETVCNPTSTTPVTVTIPQVQNLIATVSGTSVSLSWSPVTASGVWGYNVYRSTSSGFTPNATNNGIASVTGGTSYADTGLTAGTYYYVVAAMDGNGNILGTASAQVSASVIVLTPIIKTPIIVSPVSPVRIAPLLNDNVSATNTVSQTAVMLQSLQGVLDQLNAALKSL